MRGMSLSQDATSNYHAVMELSVLTPVTCAEQSEEKTLPRARGANIDTWLIVIIMAVNIYSAHVELRETPSYMLFPMSPYSVLCFYGG